MSTELPTTDVLPPFRKPYATGAVVDGMVRAKQLSRLRTEFVRGATRAAGPLVHTLQTSAIPDVDKDFRSYTTRSLRPALSRYDMVLDNSDSMTSQKHLRRLRECRTRAWFTVNRKSREVRVASNRCNLRWCPMCQRTKRYIITQGVTSWLGKVKSPKFLTLTLKSTNAPIDHQLKFLYAAFKKFRSWKFPSNVIRGGFWFFQVTYNKSTHQWHPHLHCLIDSEFLPQRKLSNAWKKATGGSPVVDIRTVTDVEKSAEYVARYATSPSSLLALTPVQGFELIEGLLGQRIVGAWGNARGIPLAPRAPEESGQWCRTWGWGTVINRRNTESVFQELFLCWKGNLPFESSFDLLEDNTRESECAWEYEPETYDQLMLEYSGPIVLAICAGECQQAPLEYHP